MSLDGSFSCESAVRQLLATIPQLQTPFRNLDLSADEVVGVVARVFLHPSYTIAVAGCFRPLNQRIVDKAVDLLRLVPRLDSDGDEAGVPDVDEGEFDVVDYYVRRDKGLSLHEVACFAFCRALDLAPFLLGSVLNYFKFSPPPFHRFLTGASSGNVSKVDPTILVRTVRVSFRYLLMDPKVFSELWNWSSMLDLRKIFVNITLSENDMLDMRWCEAQISSVILRMSDRAVSRSGLLPNEALSCYLRWKEFCIDTAVEKAGWFLDKRCEELLDGQVGSHENSLEINSRAFSQQIHEIGSKGRSWALKSCDGVSKRNTFVLTTSLRKSYEMAFLALSQKWPLLLHGPAGSGKTELIKALSVAFGSEVLFIHMDEHMDIKTLIGSYISSEHPGQFRWQLGSLTQAVMKGFWIVFEDIDKAPPDVQSILMPLLEGSNSFPTGRGEAVAVSDGFRLFSTISTSQRDLHCSKGKIAVSVLWRKVPIQRQSNEDLSVIVDAWYPCLKPCIEKLIETFRRVNSLACNQVGLLQAGIECPDAASIFSLRHLLKWCKRILGFCSSNGGVNLSTLGCKRVYQEAVDIFASYSTSVADRLSMMAEIAKLWGILIEDGKLYPPDKPVIQKFGPLVQVGRVSLQPVHKNICEESRPFASLRSSLFVLEKIACCIKYNEPVLLVGETGTGKTTLVQNLAMKLGQPLVVLNLSQQSDVADLLGGFKPVEAPSICTPLYNEFLDIFCKTYRRENNAERLFHYEKLAMKKKWEKLLDALKICVKEVLLLAEKDMKSVTGGKRKRSWSKHLDSWQSLSYRLEMARKQISGSSGMSFAFVEGAFVNALRKGQWVLLDEINLAPPEMLQRVIGVLDDENGTMCLVERGDISYVERHSSFHLFACMNPASDAGKKDLPLSIRSRFTEFFVDDILESDDLTLFVRKYLEDLSGSDEIIKKVVSFYKEAKQEAELRLQDGASQKPQFSLRSLARALEFTRKAEKKFGFRRAFYDGFCMFFLTMLDENSRIIMKRLICQLLEGVMPDDDVDNLLEKYLVPSLMSRHAYSDDGFNESYIRTKSVQENLRNIARAVYVKRYPVLLQGPTSSGKTSLVRYLASRTGHEFVRINNHEHTDLQEYFGSYITNSQGKLEFQEGVLVKAVREGYWIVLDELNLAPSDVLEALNRLLDDNRELFIPELQQRVIAHPDFMLFATQNPPTLYGGRKMLSRAFRNRFLEIHVDEIPDDELRTIIKIRCKIPESFAKKMVAVMKDLQLHRQNSNVFAGKHGFITPRDLFRWANRFNSFGQSVEDLAKEGYLLLAERLREESERRVVQEVLEKHFRVKLTMDNLYREDLHSDSELLDVGHLGAMLPNPGNLIWTKSMWRLYFLIKRCYKLREPVLLVGETGGGKTSVCQLLGSIFGLRLHILNCHQYTETSDFLGGFHPVRDRSHLISDFKNCIDQLRKTKVFIHNAGELEISYDIEKASSFLPFLDSILIKSRDVAHSHCDVTEQDIGDFRQIRQKMMLLVQKWQAFFVWHDGPLVEAMKDGDLFLIDEISLADDSVLERLNSVLEPERTLSLAEKGGSILERVIAHPKFSVLATMNPGGDFGKKELSPALRNRFTEIWVPPVTDQDELRDIALKRFSAPELKCFAEPLLSFLEWFNELHIGRTLTIRDLLSWIMFINALGRDLGPVYAFIHGSFLILLDGLSLGTFMSKDDAAKLRICCFSRLLDCLKKACIDLDDSSSVIENFGWGGNKQQIDNLQSNVSSHLFGIKPFYISKGPLNCNQEGFEFLAPTTCKNALRVLRGMQLSKPVLLEGSPGVGKTSLVIALARYSGHSIVRINLSEQTDMMDLLGSDLPVDNESRIEFAWSDGILLQAIKNGCWVLLDELNLAPQSVLEGLNAILDHRTEVFIPELNLTFKCPPTFRLFACQNPAYQGCGRKGLPKSFLNRFTKVYIDELASEDYLYICRSLYPSIPISFLDKLITLNYRVYEDTMLKHTYGMDGSPWEFNLRDVLRSCQIFQGSSQETRFESFLNVVYLQRMRTTSDRKEVLKCYQELFGKKPQLNMFPKISVNPEVLIVGNAHFKRSLFQPSKLANIDLTMLPRISHVLEAVLHCIKHRWLCILVGPASSGKTSIIRLLAQITGNCLKEVNLSSSTEVSELLGSFEQYSALDSLKSVITKVEHYVYEYSCLCLESCWENIITERKDLINRWLVFLTSNPSSRFAVGLDGGINISLHPLIEVVEQLKLDLEKYHLPVSWSHDDLNKLWRSIHDLQKNVGQPQTGKFKWVSGELINAVENGDWLVLENANLCNPSVLDRINSLVESSGSITVNECGLVEGKPLVLDANPNFRMFLTLDPSFGEVSRAMRNRGVEIFVTEADELLSAECGYPVRENVFNDVKLFLLQSGIPALKLVDAMADAHGYVKAMGQKHGAIVTFLELARWVQLFQQLVMSGNRSLWSLQVSFEHTYLSSLGEHLGGPIISHVRSHYLFDSDWFASEEGFLSLSFGWPLSLSLRETLWFSEETSVVKNCLCLASSGFQYASFNLYTETCKKVSLVDTEKVKSRMAPIELVNQLSLYYSRAKKSSKFNESSMSPLEHENSVLNIAASWAFEQATIFNFELYFRWFRWYNMLLQPHCNFFDSFLTVLEKEKSHPAWKCIFDSWHIMVDCNLISGVASLHSLLSCGLDELGCFNGCSGIDSRCFRSAISCVGLLRRSLLQQNAESEYNSDRSMELISPALHALRNLEEKVLHAIIGAHSFQELTDLTSTLLDGHIALWMSTISQHRAHGFFAWKSLMKVTLKLQRFFPETVDTLLAESLNVCKYFGMDLGSSVPMLWKYGGHPSMPSSGAVYHKMLQLLSFCNSVWPPNKSLDRAHSENSERLQVALSFSEKLRQLGLQGVCFVPYILLSGGSGENDVENQIEEIYQRLVQRVEYERSNLQLVALSITEKNTIPATSFSTACCVFSYQFLCEKIAIGWLVTRSLFDMTSISTDIELLQELCKSSLLDAGEAYKVMKEIHPRLQNALDCALKYSSRSPLDFASHQKILWLTDSWDSINHAPREMTNLIHEMWFKWHSSLWNYDFEHLKKFSVSSQDGSCPLLQPVRMATIEHIFQRQCPIIEFDAHKLMLRVASRSLCEDAPSREKFFNNLLSTARSLFEQIIFAHKKSFEEEKFKELMSLLLSLGNNPLMDGSLEVVQSLVSSSNHQTLTSLVEFVVRPLLEALYSKSCSFDCHRNMGSGWFYIGLLRFYLLYPLVNQSGPDPALKYSFKHAQIIEKISVLELEKNVRGICENVAGNDLLVKPEVQLKSALHALSLEQRRLREKVIFRNNPEDFCRLSSDCKDFFHMILKGIELVKSLEMSEAAHSWQDTAMCFVRQLSQDYPSFIDIIQPFQVAIYEMKFGLSLVASSAMHNEFLVKFGVASQETIYDTVYSLMQFPRVLPFEPCSVDKNWNVISKAMNATDIPSARMSLLTKLASVGYDGSPICMATDIQLQASICQMFLCRLNCDVSNSLLVSTSSLEMLSDIFSQIANLWLKTRAQGEGSNDSEQQMYKFRPRVVTIEDVVGELVVVDSADFDGLSPEEEEASIENKIRTMHGTGNEEPSKDEWEAIPESILNSVVAIHNRMFGSGLFGEPGIPQTCDKDRLQLFLASYKFGIRILKGLPSLLAASLDRNIVLEHLFRVSIEYEQTPSYTYNFYKEPNILEISKIVTPLLVIQRRLQSLSEEWPGHPGLQKLLDLTGILLHMPQTASVPKVLLGLHLLLGKAHQLQENASRLNINDVLGPIYSLALSWQKWELESWPVLLDEIEEQYDINAAKLWFPLHSLLHRNVSGHEDMLLTVQSMEEFVQTSTLGEFKKRVQLIIAFHGHIRTAAKLNNCISPHLEKNLNILYNITGYYIQFLPTISEQISNGRRLIENEVKELLKLFRWENREPSYFSIESFRRVKHKFCKLIKKFNDVLQQPLMGILNKEQVTKGNKFSVWLEQKTSDLSSKQSMDFPLDFVQFDEKERSACYEGWKNKLCSATDFLRFSDEDDLNRNRLPLWSEYEKFQSGWEEGWITLEMIGRNACEFAKTWKHGDKNLMKRRALGGLLKIMENCGLSRHKSSLSKDSNDISTFLLPSYKMEHMLLGNGSFSSKGITSSYNGNLSKDDCPLDWQLANQYYFCNLAMRRHLQQITLNFHKSLTLEQVQRATSFLDHLLTIQQEQRHVAYYFSDEVKKLKKEFLSLEYIGASESSLVPNQYVLLNCMWKQKSIFDGLIILCEDVLLFLHRVGCTHLSNCDFTKFNSNISHLINKFVPMFRQSKELLDKYLLGGKENIVTPLECRSIIITKEIENIIFQNFKAIRDFDEEIQNLSVAGTYVSMMTQLQNRFKSFTDMGMVLMNGLHLDCNNVDRSPDFIQSDLSSITSSSQYAEFHQNFAETSSLIIVVLETMHNAIKNHTSFGESECQNIISWDVVFKSYISKLRLEDVRHAVNRTIVSAGNLLNLPALVEPKLLSAVRVHLRHLFVLLDLLVSLSSGILSEIIKMHKTVTEISLMLAHIFASLFSKGFGDAEEQMDNKGCSGSQDVAGTGLGEGQGLNDVSDQIDDESQIPGSSEKEIEGLDHPDKKQSVDEKGIEMDDDFEADVCSISGESDDGNHEASDDEDMNLDSTMGDAGEGNQVQEKLWDKDEDEPLDDANEKYECGPSVNEIDSSSRELRGKDEKHTDMNDSAELDGQQNELSDKEANDNASDDENDTEMGMDKTDAFEEPTGIQLDKKQNSDVLEDVNEAEDMEKDDEPIDPTVTDEEEQNVGSEGHDNEIEENPHSPDNVNECHPQDSEDKVEKDERENTGKMDEDLPDETKTFAEPKAQEIRDDTMTNTDSANSINGPSAENHNMMVTANYSSELPVSPSSGLPSEGFSKMELSLPNSSSDSKLTSGQPRSQSSQDDHSLQRNHPSPYRSLGDALKEWKERVKIAPDSQEAGLNASDNMEEENADEYQFVPETDDGTSQALSSATADQVNNNIEKLGVDEKHVQPEDTEMLDTIDDESHRQYSKTLETSLIKHEAEGLAQESSTSHEVFSEAERDISRGYSESLLSFQKDFFKGNLPNRNYTGNEDYVNKTVEVGHLVDDMENNVTREWKQYELLTSKLSQELTEQLRLVLEPTLASKLQGDYKTGKRINMKKVIAYIASHFRKDKIWLRRTRPNKRDYQVIIAVDDSRSMSESHCGNFAIEALVTVCRAMSQLEVGQLAVASFGKKGNIRLLHDFDMPFSTDAGAKMISSFSFKQDNTIADEPMVDLLRSLNSMLDAAVAKSRLPSGSNPLQQLILIIADGHFHDKENVKYYIRNVLNRKRMVAFLLLDNPEDSIVTRSEVSFDGGGMNIRRYMDSFPFPYYAVLRNIETLPRTLADLLRQWFELAQNANE